MSKHDTVPLHTGTIGAALKQEPARVPPVRVAPMPGSIKAHAGPVEPVTAGPWRPNPDVVIGADNIRPQGQSPKVGIGVPTVLGQRSRTAAHEVGPNK